MSDNKNPKVLTLDNIDILKTYIDRNIKSVNEQISDTDKKWEDKYNVISEEQQEKLNEKIEEAKNNLTERYEEKLANLESKINNATDEELSILINKIEILKSDFEQCNTALDKIKEDISDDSSIFNAAELDELINCANIEETYVDEDGNLNSEKILAKNITALVARFGTVKAESLTGDLIEGKTVVSLEKSPYSEKPMWGLYPDGSGHLAGGNIEWNTTGNVVLGPDVKISWDNVTGKDDFLNNVIENYDDTIKAYISNYINDEAGEALSSALAEVEILRDEAELAVKNLNTTLNEQLLVINSTISENKEAIEAELENAREEAYNNAINAVKEFQEGEFKTQTTALYTTLEATEKALKDAIAEGNTELISKLSELRGEIEGKIARATYEASEATAAVVNLNTEIKDFRNSALMKEDAVDLLAASLIETTEITGEQISTPSLLAKKIVGLVATFGSVRASKIVGTTIQGYTVSSPTELKNEDGTPVYEEDSYELEVDENGNPIQAIDKDGNLLFETDSEGNKVPVYKYASAYNETTGKYEKIPKIAQKDPKDIAWQLNSDGSGWLANHNISWEQNGDITLSDKVTIKWEQVDGGQGAVDNAKTDAINTANSNTDSKINSAKTYLENQIVVAKNELNTTINNLNTTFSSQLNTNKQELLVDTESKITIALETTSSDLNNTKTNLEKAIADGNTELSNEIDGVRNSILSENKVNELATAAIIEGTTITGDSISSENILAKNIVSLASTFAEVQAENIKGTKIEGKTICSTTKIGGSGTNKDLSTWQINNDGDGWLANKNISWDTNGTINIGAIQGVNLIINYDGSAEFIYETDSANYGLKLNPSETSPIQMNFGSGYKTVRPETITYEYSEEASKNDARTITVLTLN